MTLLHGRVDETVGDEGPEGQQAGMSGQHDSGTQKFWDVGRKESSLGLVLDVDLENKLQKTYLLYYFIILGILGNG